MTTGFCFRMSLSIRRWCNAEQRLAVLPTRNRLELTTRMQKWMLCLSGCISAWIWMRCWLCPGRISRSVNKSRWWGGRWFVTIIGGSWIRILRSRNFLWLVRWHSILMRCCVGWQMLGGCPFYLQFRFRWNHKVYNIRLCFAWSSFSWIKCP